MTLTIFTPTFNRAYRLPDLYESLCRQSCKEFEWIVVDDGSTDDTERLFKEWLSESSFTIKYIKQPNGGKHRAINRGVKEAKGEFFFIVDSDDKLTSDAVETILNYANQIRDDEHCGGVIGFRVYPDGKRIGGEVANFKPMRCTRFDFRHKYNVKGDLAEVFKTTVMKEYPFPEYAGEKFCPEAYVWEDMAMRYDFLFFCKGTYVCEYLEDGLTNHIDQVRIKSPRGSAECYVICHKAPVPLKIKIKDSINYWRFRFHCKNDIKPDVIISPWALPLGWLFYKRDCFKYPEICKK